MDSKDVHGAHQGKYQVIAGTIDTHLIRRNPIVKQYRIDLPGGRIKIINRILTGTFAEEISVTSSIAHQDIVACA
ncbi:hypothetical protein, partial [Nitrosococcus oceani]|uniref:hypothetical protein n=1 Tax=Nitrosococcus oceani TaxID=1229 RepID=UPI0012E0AFB4